MTVVQGFINQPHITVPGRGASFGSVPLDQRFWAKVVKSESCWNWRGSTNRGRGTININGRPKFASVISWELAFGKVPYGLVVCHKCDNPLCVRPDHLFLGTQRDNVHDAISKGRLKNPPAYRAEKSPTAKLNWKIVREIRRNKTDTLSALAKRYGVCIATVGNIKNNKVWKE